MTLLYIFDIGLHDLQCDDKNEDETNFLDNMRHIQKHRRGRAMRRLVKQIKDEAEQLRIEVARLIASRKPGGQVEADFCKFPSPQLSKALQEDLSDYKVVGRITMNGNSDEVRIKTVPIIVGPQDLRRIHQKVLS